MKKQKTVLYIYPHIATFIQRDFRIIEKHFRLLTYEFKPSGNVRLLLNFVNQFFFLLGHFREADIVVCMFLGYHSLLPAVLCRMFGKPCLAIIGGTECHSYPSINYGSLRKPVYAWFTRMSFRNCTHIAPVHESLVMWKDVYYAKDYPSQGYKYFFPEVAVPYTPVYNGYDAEEFKPIPGVEKTTNSFLTVAGTINGGEFYRKGADLIIAAARSFPDYKFTIIGNSNKALPELPNLKVIPNMPVHELLPYFSKSEFYFQLSIAEGFPNAICEAMLCECIPIGSSAFGIPLIIGDTGFILQKKDEAMLMELVSSAVNSDKRFLAKAARERIKNNFTQARREGELVALILNLLGTKYSS